MEQHSATPSTDDETDDIMAVLGAQPTREDVHIVNPRMISLLEE